MSLASINFGLFVVCAILLYFIFPVDKYKYLILLIASYVYYIYSDISNVVYILFTTVTTYFATNYMGIISRKGKAVIEENKENWSKQEKKDYKKQIKNQRKRIMVMTLVFNFGILAVLKLMLFLIKELQGGNADAQLLSTNLMIPLGISFFTFQTMGYVIDVYYEKVMPERNFFKIALFTSFFPQIIQGPISFYSELAHQLYEPHRFSFQRTKHGTELILWGLFKKLVIADRAIILINHVMADSTSYSGTVLFFVLLVYALQIYADFSGGIDVVRGISQILGIELAKNFERPYFARTINDYWRRWHISLGAWLRTYLFYPVALSEVATKSSNLVKNSSLGKTKYGEHLYKVLPTCIASFVVFMVVGIWHGLNSKYLAFGFWNASIVAGSALLKPFFDWMGKVFKVKQSSPLFILFQMFRTFVLVLIGYVFDIAQNCKDGLDVIYKILFEQEMGSFVTQLSGVNLSCFDYVLLLVCVFVILTISIIQEKYKDTTLRCLIDRKPFVLEWFLLVVGVVVILTLGVYGPDYDASSFVYMQF